MAEYKNSIKLGVSLPQQNDIQGQLNTLIKNLNDTKINLDINIANSDVAKQLELLTNLANNFKNSLGGNINLGNVSEVVNQVTTAMNGLNGETLKNTTKIFGDIITNTQKVATGIGEVAQQTTKFQNINGELKKMDTVITTVTEDTQKFNSSMQQIQNALKLLDNIKLNGLVNTESIDKLKNDLNVIYEESNKSNGIKFSDSELKTYLEQVKQLETEEKNLIQVQQQENEVNSKLNNNEFLTNQKNAYTNLTQLLNEEFSIKQKLITAEGEYKAKLEESLITNRLLQNEQNANIKDNNLSNLQKEIELENQRVKLQEQYNLANAKNNDKVNDASLKQEQEKEQLLLRQAEAYKQIDVLKNNGIVSSDDISKLEKMVQEANSLKDINSALKSIMNTSMFNESSIVSISKQIDDLQLKLTKMKQTFGERLSNSFIDSTEAELNKLKEDLKNVDGMNFNGIKNSLNSVKSSMEQVSNETRQMINATKETNTGSFFTSMSDFLSKSGLFYGTVQAVQMLVSAVKEGVQWNKYLNDSFTDMSITMNISEQEFNKMSASIDDMGKKIGVNAQDIHDIARVYANANTDVDTILAKIKPEAMLSNVSGIKGDSITKTIQATTYAFDMLNETESNAGQATEHIGDILTKVSQNMRYDFQAGIVGLNDAIKTAGSTARESGMSFEQFSAYMGALIERTGKTGNELGTFFKTLTARVQQIKAVGDEVGVTREQMSNAEKALTAVGVSVRGQNGSMRDMDSILKDLSAKWGTFNDQQKSNIAFGVAGNIHRNTFLSLMKSMTTEQKLYNDAMSANGALEEANEKRAESYQGKLNTLKTTFNQLSTTMINSNLLSGGIDVATGVLGGLNTIASTFRTIPTIVSAVVGAMTILNTKFRENVNLVSGSLLPGYTTFTNYLSGLRNNLATSASQQAKNIAVSKAFMQASQEAGMSTRGMATELVGMEAKLLATRLGMVACTVATVALQTALSMGVALIASMAITGLMNLANSSENAKQKIDELSSSIKEERNSISQSEELLSKKTDLENQISKTSEGTKENTDLKKQLLDVERQISDVLPSSTSGFDSEGKAISANTDLIKAQIQVKKDKLAVDAQELISNAKDVDALMKKFELTQKQLDAVKLAQKQGKTSATIPVSLDSDETQNIGISPKYISETEKDLNEWKSTISSVRLAILQLKQAGKSDDEIKAMFPNIDISAINNFSGAVEDSTNKIETNSNAKSDNAKNTKILADATNELKANNNQLSTETIDKLNEAYPNMGINAENAKDKVEELNKTVSAGDDNEVKKATQAYSDATKSIAQAEQYLQKLNKAQAITPTLAKQMSKTYGDEVLTSLQNASDAQEFLTNKIKEAKEVQENNYEILIGDDQSFYQQKIANNQEFQNAYTQFLNSFNEDGEQAYQVDFSNYKTLNELKQGTMSDFGVEVNNWLSKYVDTSADGYNIDLSNFKSIAQAKEAILQVLNEEIKKINDNLAGAQWMTEQLANRVKDEQEGYSDQFDITMSKHLSDDIDGYKSKIGDLNSAVKEVGANFDGIGAQMQGFGGTTDFGGGSSSGKSGKSDAEKAEKEAEKATEKAEKLKEEIDALKSDIEPDRYLDFNNAVKQVDNELDLNKSLKDSLKKDSPEYQNALSKDIDLYKQKQQSLNALNEEQKKERDELKAKLSSMSFQFDANGRLINSQQRLLEMQESINAMTGTTEAEKKAKEDAIKWLKDLQKDTENYTNLVGDKIPKITEEWQEQANAIAKAKDEMRESLANFRDELANDILEDLKKDAEKAEEEADEAEDRAKKALESEKEAKAKYWDDRIKALQEQLNALNDTEDDEKAKLKKLQAERALWSQDNSALAKNKIAKLDEEIADTTKTIQKDDLQKQIDDLNKKKDADNDSYEKKLKNLDEYNEKRKKKEKEANDDSLLEQKAYAQADEMIKKNEQDKIIALLEKYGKSYKDVGTLLGENFKDGWVAQIQQARAEYERLMGDLLSNDPIKGATGFDVGGNGSGTDGIGAFSDAISKALGLSNLARYDTGGRVPNTSSEDGMLAKVDSGEKILNYKDTVMVDEIYDWIRNAGNELMKQIQVQSQNYNPQNYTSPILNATISDLNKLGNAITDNSNNPVNIKNEFNVTNTSNVQARSTEQNIADLIKQNVLHYGKRI